MFETTFHFHLYLFMNNNIQDEQQTYIFSWTAIYKTNNNQLVFRILQFTTISTQSARMKFKNQSLKVEAWNARSFKTAAWAQQWLWKSPKVAMMIQGPPFRHDSIEIRLVWLFKIYIQYYTFKVYTWQLRRIWARSCTPSAPNREPPSLYLRYMLKLSERKIYHRQPSTRF